MISFYLLTAHLIGDFVLQTDHMAKHKLDNARVRAFYTSGRTLYRFFP